MFGALVYFEARALHVLRLFLFFFVLPPNMYSAYELNLVWTEYPCLLFGCA